MSESLAQLSLKEYAAFCRELELLRNTSDGAHPESNCTSERLASLAREYLSHTESEGYSLESDRGFASHVVNLMRDDLREESGKTHRRMEVILAPLCPYLPAQGSCAEHASAMDAEDSVDAFMAALAADISHLQTYYIERFLAWRNGCVQKAADEALVEWKRRSVPHGCGVVHSEEEVALFNDTFAKVTQGWLPIPAEALNSLLKGLHPQALAETIRRKQIEASGTSALSWDHYWNELAPTEQSYELGLAGAVERCLLQELRLGEGLSLPVQAWIESRGYLLKELDFSEISPNIDDSLIEWLLRVAPNLEALVLAGCYHVSDAAVQEGHGKLKLLDVSDTGVDRLDQWRSKFPALERLDAQHSGRRVRVLEHLPELQTFLNGTSAQKEIASWQIRQVLSLTPHLIAERRTVLRLLQELRDSIYSPHSANTIEFVGMILWRIESHEDRKTVCADLLEMLKQLSVDHNVSAEVLLALTQQLSLLFSTLGGEQCINSWKSLVELLLSSLDELEAEGYVSQEAVATTSTIHAIAEQLAYVPEYAVIDLQAQWKELLKSYTTVVNKILAQQVDDPVPLGDHARDRISRLLQTSWAHQHCIYRLLENEGLDEEYRMTLLEAFLNSIKNPFEAPARVDDSFLGIQVSTEDRGRSPGPFTQTMMDYSLAVALVQENLPVQLRESVLRHVLAICVTYREARFPNLYRILVGGSHRRDLPRAYRYNPLVRAVWEYEGIFNEEISEELKQQFRTGIIHSHFGPKDDLYIEVLANLYQMEATPEDDKKRIIARLNSLGRWYKRFMIGHKRDLFFTARSALKHL